MRNARSITLVGGALLATAALAVGVVAVQAATFGQVAGANQDLGQVPPPVWPTIAPTPCATDPCAVTLEAGQGTLTVADTTAPGATAHVPYFGFDVNGQPGGYSLAGGPNSTIKVPAGTTLTITLTQTADVADPIELSFPSLPAADVSHAGNVYTVHANTVGTSVFQPGSNADAPRQVAMGLVGVLVVTPAACSACAFDESQQYDDEAIVAMTDIDLEFATHRTSFDMSYFGQPRDADDHPRAVYHLINGKSFPDTDVVDVRNGDSVLLRYVNAGVTDKSMGLLGLRQTLLGRNASAYTDPQSLIAPLIGPGETADVAVAIPTSATAGQRYSLMDQGRQMNHGTAAGFGGALTFLNVWAGAPTTPTVSLTPFDVGAGTTDASAQSSAPAFTITGYRTAVTSSPSAPPTDPPDPAWSTITSLPTPTTPSASFTVSATAAGGQYVWVQVQQSGGTWSSPASVEVPVTTVAIDPLTLTGTALAATATATPSSAQVAGMSYAINDATFATSTALTVGGAPANSVSGTATLPDPLVDGDVVSVRADSPTIVGGHSAPAQVTVVGPQIDAATTSITGDTLTVGASSADSMITDVYVSTGTTAMAPGGGISVGDGSLPTSPYSGTVTLSTTFDPVPAAGDTVWVRVKDGSGVWSRPFSVTVPAP